jgi:FkbM family methyltransferase
VTFVSHAQFGEDLTLWAALNHITAGRYVDVGASHPENMSISFGFYEQGWSGITVEPIAGYCEEHRLTRPRDLLAEGVAADTDGEVAVFYVIDGTGLSTLRPDIADRHRQGGYGPIQMKVPTFRLDTLLAAAGWEMGDDIHFMSIDVEGAEATVLAGVHLEAWRPWYLVIEAVAPLQSTPTHDEWEPTVLAAGYEFFHADAVNRFYHLPKR